MKITEKRLRLVSGIIMLIGVIISIFFDSAGNYIGIALIIIGMILLAPWVKDEKK